MKGKFIFIGIILALFIVILGVILLAPEKVDQYPNDITQTITLDGFERSYIIHTPAGYVSSKKYPLVFDFHGGGGTSEAERKSKGMNEKADKEGFIVVYPQGLSQDRLINSKGGTWNVGPDGGGYAFDQNVNDITFVKEMIRFMKSNYSIDEKRIYSAGLSMGGMISYKLACEMSDTFAAVAPIGTSLTTSPCTPVRPISIMDFKGTDDNMIPFLGGPTDPSVPKFMVIGKSYMSHKDVIDFWVKTNNCTGDPVVTFKGPETTCVSYSNCSQGSEVATCISQGAGHTWPGTKNFFDNTPLAQYSGKTAMDINATDLMWEFFKNHPLP